MINARNSIFVRLAALVALATFFAPAPAKAWFRGGVFFGFPPVVIGPPVVAYPPAYYPPPYYAPGYYAPAYPPPAAYPPPPEPGYAPAQAEEAPPPQAQAPQMSQADTPFGTTCYAGNYVCRAPAQSHVDTGCSCPGLGAPSYGVVR